MTIPQARFKASMCGPLFALLLVNSTCLADAQLDDMMREMGEKRSTSSPIKQTVREAVANTAEAISNTFNSVLSSFSSVRTAPAEDQDDYLSVLDGAQDTSESLNSRFWSSARETYQEAKDAIQNFPFPHFYWAPGIVGDYTEAMFKKVDQEFFPNQQDQN